MIRRALERVYWNLDIEHRISRAKVRVADLVLASLHDGEVFALQGLYGRVVRFLAGFAGERGDSEGVMDVLLRIVTEREEAQYSDKFTAGFKQALDMVEGALARDHLLVIDGADGKRYQLGELISAVRVQRRLFGDLVGTCTGPSAEGSER